MTLAEIVNTVILGDSLSILRTLPPDSIDCCLSSPPYWGLRSYGTNPQVWDADIFLTCGDCCGIIRIDRNDYTIKEVKENEEYNQARKQPDNRNLSNLSETDNQILSKQQTSEENRKGMLQIPQHKDCFSGRQMASTEPKIQHGGSQYELEGWNKENRWIHNEISEKSSSFCKGLCNGTQISNGKTSKTIFEELGKSPPQERNKERQQNRKSGVGQLEKSLRRNNMSSLPQNIFNQIICPICNSKNLIETNCQHEWLDTTYVRNNDKTAGIIQRGNKGSVGRDEPIKNAFCSKCSAWRGELGLEPTPELYVKHITEIFREVRRVLKKEGTCFLNLGDSYSAQRWTGTGKGQTMNKFQDGYRDINPEKNTGLPDKNLVGIPWAVAFALRQNGWYLRQDIIWAKPNPMPESVTGSRWEKHRIKIANSKHATEFNIKGGEKAMLKSGGKSGHGMSADWLAKWKDCPGCPICLPNDGYVLSMSAGRCTKSHEYIFLLTKSPKYYFDNISILEPANFDGRKDTVMKGSQKYADGFVPGQSAQSVAVRGHERWPSKIIGRTEKKMAGTGYGGDGTGLHGHSGYYDGDGKLRMNIDPNGIPARNKRSVWTITTKPYSGAHFATFPEDLVKPMILAGTSEWGVCPDCGKAWVRVMEYTRGTFNQDYLKGKTVQTQEGGKLSSTLSGEQGISKTIGWKPTCACGKKPIPAIVLDPFMGAGTMGLVAKKLGRNYIGIELKQEYIDMSIKRINAIEKPLF